VASLPRCCQSLQTVAFDLFDSVLTPQSSQQQALQQRWPQPPLVGRDKDIGFIDNDVLHNAFRPAPVRKPKDKARLE
jgi:hypothetical protein